MPQTGSRRASRATANSTALSAMRARSHAFFSTLFRPAQTAKTTSATTSAASTTTNSMATTFPRWLYIYVHGAAPSRSCGARCNSRGQDALPTSRQFMSRINLGVTASHLIGDFKAVGSGVVELRFDTGPGYRAHITEEGDTSPPHWWRQVAPTIGYRESQGTREGMRATEWPLR